MRRSVSVTTRDEKCERGRYAEELACVEWIHEERIERENVHPRVKAAAYTQIFNTIRKDRNMNRHRIILRDNT